jgi:hypothetical protein
VGVKHDGRQDIISSAVSVLPDTFEAFRLA